MKTDIDITIRVAELLGWQWTELNRADREFITKWWGGKPVGQHPERKGEDVTKSLQELPDYCNDLNAMHEAEETLTWDEGHAFNEYLYVHMPQDQHLYHAKPRIRAEAFIAVKEATNSSNK